MASKLAAGGGAAGWLRSRGALSRISSSKASGARDMSGVYWRQAGDSKPGWEDGYVHSSSAANPAVGGRNVTCGRAAFPSDSEGRQRGGEAVAGGRGESECEGRGRESGADGGGAFWRG